MSGRNAFSPALRLAVLGALALASAIAFMTLVQTDWDFIIQHRGPRLGAMLLVAYAIGVSTVLFQTITHNRILTPSLMGFDVLFVLVQALALFLWGAGQLASLPVALRFVCEVLAVVLLALLIFRLLFSGAARSLHLIISVPIFLEHEKREMKVEVQLRTVAMDFWASLEHKIRYKKDLPDELAESLYDELLECAILSTDLDKRMQNIRNQLDQVHSDGPAHIIGPSDLD